MLHTLLCLLPIAVVSLPLLARRYPGERVLLALRDSRPTRPTRQLPCRVRSHGRTVIATVHGAQLIGRSLAVRPPPGLLAAS